MKKKLKAVLFDMDGVLFNSMPYHSEAWHKVMKSHGLTLSREEAYMHEGRTGAATINIVFQRELGREATQEEIESIYQEKSVLFNSYAEAERMPGAWELLQKVKGEGLTPMVVTGSGQLSLLERLEHNFPGMFHKELMVTAFDVKYGKPNPEPYLMALKKRWSESRRSGGSGERTSRGGSRTQSRHFHNRCEHGTSGRTGIAGLRSRFITTVHASAL